MPEEVQSPGKQEPIKETPVQTAHKINWIHILIGVVFGAVLLGAGFGVYLLTQSKSETTNEPTQVSIPNAKQATPSASATPSADKDETKGWKVYTNEDLRVQVKYPVSWYVYDNATSPCTDRIPTYVFVNKEPLAECLFGDVLPADFYVSVGSSWTPIPDEFDTYKSYTISGERGFINITTEKSQGPRRKETRIIVTYKEKGYTISLPNTDYEGTHEKIYDTILSTFKFLD